MRKGDDLTTFIVPKVEKIRSLNLPEPQGPTRPVAGHLYLTFLDEGEWLTPCPGRFTHGEKKTRYQLYRRLGRPHGRSGRIQKTSPPPNLFCILLQSVDLLHPCFFLCPDCPAFCLSVFFTYNTQTSMPPAGFESSTQAGERRQNYALDRAATGIGIDPRTVHPVASRYTD